MLYGVPARSEDVYSCSAIMPSSRSARRCPGWCLTLPTPGGTPAGRDQESELREPAEHRRQQLALNLSLPGDTLPSAAGVRSAAVGSA
jgi:hypothetical protein